MTLKVRLNGTELQNFQAELDQLRANIMADLGAEDANYIRKISRKLLRTWSLAITYYTANTIG